MWKLFYDGACQGNPGKTGLGVVLVSPEGSEAATIAKAGQFGTNNTAEYDALYLGLKLALHHKVDALAVYGDSQLVTNQVTGKFKCEKPELKKRLAAVKQLLSQFESVSIEWIRRNKNERADELSKQGLSKCENKASEEPTDIKVIPHPGVGFTVIEDSVIHAINFKPNLNCTCQEWVDQAECRHVRYLKSLC